MPRFPINREWIAAVLFGVVLITAILAAVIGFSLDAIITFLLAAAVLSGGIFGELRDTWDTERRFSVPRAFFRTFEWTSLAVAGYIIFSVITNGADAVH